MNINIISEMIPSQLTGQPKDDLAVTDDLFQQLLMSNKKRVQETDKLPHTVKQPVNCDDEVEDLEQNFDIIAMILPSLDRFVVEPTQFLTTNSNSLANLNQKLNNRLLTSNATTLEKHDQLSEKLPVDASIDTKHLRMIHEQVTPLVKSTVILTDINQSSVHEVTQQTINSLLIESDIDMVNKPTTLVSSTHTGETPWHFYPMVESSKVVTKNNFPDNYVQSPLLLTATTIPQSMNLSMPVNINQWQTSLTQQIVMLNQQNIPTAEIKLHPQELGSLHIKLTMHDDNMNLHLMAAHTTVKEVLEAALPLLKTSLEQQGIILQQADVSNFSMMNNSQQSSMFQPPKMHKPTKIALSDSESEFEQNSLSQTDVPVGLSIFA